MRFLLPFELASFLLLVAAVGAVALAGRRPGIDADDLPVAPRRGLVEYAPLGRHRHDGRGRRRLRRHAPMPAPSEDEDAETGRSRGSPA